MCGVFGEFAFNSALIGKDEFLKVNELSFRRGPDSAGHYTNDKNVQFGFNRLAILDTSENGNQPVQSPSGRYAMVFNGEVYNHLEIREQLLAAGYKFRGNSDTETIAASFDHFGLRKTVEQLDGMFGIGLYDHHEGKMHLIRDFAGIKPMFYGVRNGKVVFASQYNQVSLHPQFRDASIDPVALKIFMRYVFLPAPYAMHEGTHQVRPGEIVSIDSDGSIGKERYWEFPSTAEPTYFDEKSALDRMEEVLSDAVRAEMLSDVPLGAFLSGGIDSPLIAGYAQRHAEQKLNAFTIAGSSPKHDESGNARILAEAFGCNLHVEQLEDTQINVILEDALSTLGEPCADFSIVPTYLVSKLARKQVTVALSGDGGDELFFGYDRFYSVIKNRNFQGSPDLVKKLVYGFNKVTNKNKKINSNVLRSSMADSHAFYHTKFSDDQIHQYFPDLRSVEIPEEFDHFDYSDSKNELEMLGKMRKTEFEIMLQKSLRKTDMASMGSSLEVRVPFLKKSTIEASFQIDPFLSYGPTLQKELLKKLLLKLTPKAPVRSPKKGFYIPLRTALMGRLEEHHEKMLSVKDTLGMNEGALAQLKGAATADNKFQSTFFTLFALSHWAERNNSWTA